MGLCLLLGCFLATGTFACAVCMGDTASPLNRSAGWAMLFLLAVVLCVLGVFVRVMTTWRRREAELLRGLEIHPP